MIININNVWGFVLQASYDTAPDRIAISFKADRYSDFVINCLNGNYDKLLGLPAVEIDEEADTPLDTAMREYQANEYPKERLPVLRDDLSKLRLDIYTQLIEKMYIDKKYDYLSPEHKYHAFMISQEIHPAPSKNMFSSLWADLPAFAEYSSTVRISSDYTDADFDWQDVIRDDIEEARSMYSGEALYDAICKIGADRTEKYKIGSYPTFDSFREVFVFLFHEMIKDKLRIIRCKHCGKYFVPERAYSQYCDEPSPEDPQKTCQEYVRYNNYLNSQTEASKLHKRIYNRLNNRWKRTVSNQKLKDEVDTFLIMSEIKRKQVVKGEITENQYIEWLKDIEADKIEIKPLTAL